MSRDPERCPTTGALVDACRHCADDLPIDTPEHDDPEESPVATDAPTYPPPLLDSCGEHYGLHVTPIGEEGAFVVLGHHADQRRVVAAVARSHRTVIGETLGQQTDAVEAYMRTLQELDERWAVLVLPCAEHELVAAEARRWTLAPGCAACRARALAQPDDEWALCWVMSADAADAFPVTVFDPW